LVKLTVNVHLNMSQPNNRKTRDHRLIPQGDQRRYTGEILVRTRPKTYRAIARELAEPNASVNSIARRYRVSNHTVMGIREREAKSIAERKNTLAAKLASVAELGAERMEETIGKAGLRDAAIGTGIAVDKMLALTGQTPALQIVNIPLPSAEEVAERKAIHDKLSLIFKTDSWDVPP
jgi:transposase-like protein